MSTQFITPSEYYRSGLNSIRFDIRDSDSILGLLGLLGFGILNSQLITWCSRKLQALACVELVERGEQVASVVCVLYLLER